MFQDIADLLTKINQNLEKSNMLLAQIEENLRVPNMIKWAEKIKK